ncbi:MAG: Lipase 2 [Lachnoclostridium sp.]|jgi:acetyl esterase/lipase
MSETSDRIRKNFKAADDVRDAGLETPEFVERFDNILYGTDKKWQVLDVYRPKNLPSRKLPVIVSVHGGGWVYGDKERYQFYCMSLVKHNFAVVNFTYRLAPEFKYPAPIEDTNLVFHWIFQNAEKYGFDTDHIFAVGDSAGAHCLGLYTAICTNEEYAGKYDFKVPEGFVPTAIGLNCGVYKIDLNGGSDDSTAKLMADYLPNGGSPEEIDLICVTNHITEKYPPVTFMTCTGDFLKDQALILLNKLMEKKIPHEFHFYGDYRTELGHVFNLNIKLEEAEKCNKIECDFFHRYI